MSPDPILVIKDLVKEFRAGKSGLMGIRRASGSCPGWSKFQPC